MFCGTLYCKRIFSDCGPSPFLLAFSALHDGQLGAGGLFVRIFFFSNLVFGCRISSYPSLDVLMAGTDPSIMTLLYVCSVSKPLPSLCLSVISLTFRYMVESAETIKTRIPIIVDQYPCSFHFFGLHNVPSSSPSICQMRLSCSRMICWVALISACCLKS